MQGHICASHAFYFYDLKKLQTRVTPIFQGITENIYLFFSPPPTQS